MKVCKRCGKHINALTQYKFGNDYYCCECYECKQLGVEDEESTEIIAPIINQNHNENEISNKIRNIGKDIIALGLIAGIIIWVIIANEVNVITGFIAFLIEAIVCSISGMFFIGLSEIINLLQNNVNNTTELLRRLDKKD